MILSTLPHKLPVTRHPLPVTRYPLPVTRYPLLVTSYPSPVTRYQLPVTSYPLPVTRYPLPVTSYPLPVTSYSPRRLRRLPLPTRHQLLAIGHRSTGRLLLPVDLGPDGQHHIAEHERIQRDEGDVAAEVEGEHAADEEEEHAARLVPLQVLPGEDRHPQRHQERRGEHAEEWPEIHHPLPLACEARRLLPQADHPRRDRRPHARLRIHGFPALPARDRVVDSDERLALLTTFPSS